jgi:hypothetical protein
MFRDRGLLYGLALSLVMVYPLGRQGTELLTFPPALVPLAFFTFLFVALVFVTYAVALELVLRRWHHFHDVTVPSPTVREG